MFTHHYGVLLLKRPQYYLLRPFCLLHGCPECSVTNFKVSIDDWFKQFGFERNVVAAPCFSIVPMYLKTTDSIVFLPLRAIKCLNLIEIPPGRVELCGLKFVQSRGD